MPKPRGKILEPAEFEAAVEELGISGKAVEAARRILVEGESRPAVLRSAGVALGVLNRTTERLEFAGRRYRAARRSA